MKPEQHNSEKTTASEAAEKENMTLVGRAAEKAKPSKPPRVEERLNELNAKADSTNAKLADIAARQEEFIKNHGNMPAPGIKRAKGVKTAKPPEYYEYTYKAQRTQAVLEGARSAAWVAVWGAFIYGAYFHNSNK